MPSTPPPPHYDGTPNSYLLSRGTCLWRVHSRPRPPWAFNPCAADMLFGGGRFDATAADRYACYYAGLDETTALAESLLRDLYPDERGTRALPRAAVDGRRIAGVTLTSDLVLVRLINGADLGAISQDAWLVTAAGNEYAQTRGWAHWLRSQAPAAHGFIWSSYRNTGGRAIVLFGDRCAAEFGDDYERTLLYDVPPLAVDLDDKAGADWLTARLEPFRVAVAPPGEL